MSSYQRRNLVISKGAERLESQLEAAGFLPVPPGRALKLFYRAGEFVRIAYHPVHTDVCRITYSFPQEERPDVRTLLDELEGKGP